MIRITIIESVILIIYSLGGINVEDKYERQQKVNKFISVVNLELNELELLIKFIDSNSKNMKNIKKDAYNGIKAIKKKIKKIEKSGYSKKELSKHLKLKKIDKYYAQIGENDNGQSN